MSSHESVRPSLAMCRQVKARINNILCQAAEMCRRPGGPPAICKMKAGSIEMHQACSAVLVLFRFSKPFKRKNPADAFQDVITVVQPVRAENFLEIPCRHYAVSADQPLEEQQFLRSFAVQ